MTTHMDMDPPSESLYLKFLGR